MISNMDCLIRKHRAMEAQTKRRILDVQRCVKIYAWYKARFIRERERYRDSPSTAPPNINWFARRVAWFIAVAIEVRGCMPGWFPELKKVIDPETGKKRFSMDFAMTVWDGASWKSYMFGDYPTDADSELKVMKMNP